MPGETLRQPSTRDDAAESKGHQHPVSAEFSAGNTDMTRVTFIVEDSQIIRDALIPSLQELAGAEVAGIAETEGAAVRWLEANDRCWDFAVIDLFLREGSGLGVLAAIRARESHQHAVVLTNYPTPAMRTQCIALGADAVFDKSTELENFFDFFSAVQDRASS